VVTNAAGTIVEDSDFYPFGGERVFTDTLPDQNYKFTSKERDYESASQLDYFVARHYAWRLGRFLQPDEFAGVRFRTFLLLQSGTRNDTSTVGKIVAHAAP
jgi:RHS repeat-associated protein